MSELALRDIDSSELPDDAWDIEFQLSMRALFMDGTSEYSELVSPELDDIQDTIIDLNTTDEGRRVDQLDDEGRGRYHRWFDEHAECRCDYVCGGWPCTHDVSDRDEWLKRRTKGGVILEWRWHPIEATGSGIVELSEVDYVEYPVLASEIHGQIE